MVKMSEWQPQLAYRVPSIAVYEPPLARDAKRKRGCIPTRFHEPMVSAPVIRPNIFEVVARTDCGSGARKIELRRVPGREAQVEIGRKLRVIFMGRWGPVWDSIRDRPRLVEIESTKARAILGSRHTGAKVFALSEDGGKLQLGEIGIGRTEAKKLQELFSGPGIRFFFAQYSGGILMRDKEDVASIQ
ncbi:MAG: hypothetical protein AB1657_00320 [Candidatus Micrarchaeota archaeon]